jgi:hypothetical protein
VFPGADSGFQVRGGALKKFAPIEGRREKFWGISCEKSRFIKLLCNVVNQSIDIIIYSCSRSVVFGSFFRYFHVKVQSLRTTSVVNIVTSKTTEREQLYIIMSID